MREGAGARLRRRSIASVRIKLSPPIRREFIQWLRGLRRLSEEEAEVARRTLAFAAPWLDPLLDEWRSLVEPLGWQESTRSMEPMRNCVRYWDEYFGGDVFCGIRASNDDVFHFVFERTGAWSFNVRAEFCRHDPPIIVGKDTRPFTPFPEDVQIALANALVSTRSEQERARLASRWHTVTSRG